jgi:hypothetical protein
MSKGLITLLLDLHFGPQINQALSCIRTGSDSEQVVGIGAKEHWLKIKYGPRDWERLPLHQMRRHIEHDLISEVSALLIRGDLYLVKSHRVCQEVFVQLCVAIGDGTMMLQRCSNPPEGESRAPPDFPP